MEFKIRFSPVVAPALKNLKEVGGILTQFSNLGTVYPTHFYGIVLANLQVRLELDQA